MELIIEDLDQGRVRITFQVDVSMIQSSCLPLFDYRKEANDLIAERLKELEGRGYITKKDKWLNWQPNVDATSFTNVPMGRLVVAVRIITKKVNEGEGFVQCMGYFIDQLEERKK